jgi:glycosyltransferase involved in cell wall biosynthesis
MTAGSTRPTVSVIITTRNRAAVLDEALASVFAVERAGFDLQVIVVNDGSTDDTLDMIAKYDTTVITTSGVGMAPARNIGLHAATGAYVTLLDDDDVWLPTNIGPQVALLEARPELGAAHGQSQIADENLEPFGDPFPTGPLPSGWLLEELLTYFPQVATVVTRRSVAEEIGDMDPSLTGDSDWDWLLRVAARYQIGRVEQPVMLFRQRPASNIEQSWRRFPAVRTIYRRHTRQFGLAKRARLEIGLRRIHGQWAWEFSRDAMNYWQQGERKRALRAAVYSLRASAPHALLAYARADVQARQARKTSTAH